MNSAVLHMHSDVPTMLSHFKTNSFERLQS